jgi:hypothetical protein
VLYGDRRIECASTYLLFRVYYFPLGWPKALPYRRIRAVERFSLTAWAGKWRIWGTTSPCYWANLDPGRPRRWVGLIPYLPGLVRPWISPDDPDAVEAILNEGRGRAGRGWSSRGDGRRPGASPSDFGPGRRVGSGAEAAMRRAAAAILVLGLLAAACMQEGEEAATTLTPSTSTTAPAATTSSSPTTTTGTTTTISTITTTSAASTTSTTTQAIEPTPQLRPHARTYGGDLNDWLYDVLLLPDGGTLAAGQANTPGPSHRITRGNAHLIRTDCEGNVVWERDYGGEVDAMFYSLIQVGEDEYLILGSIAASYVRNETDFYLVKSMGRETRSGRIRTAAPAWTTRRWSVRHRTVGTSWSAVEPMTS